MSGAVQIFVVGSANMDLVLPVERMPRPGETLTGRDLALIPGGKGANQACAVARLGGRVAMMGAVGEDAFGTALTTSLQQAGVETAAIRRAARPTGCACIYVLPGGENSIVISPGANATVLPETVLPQLGQLARGTFLLAQLEIPLSTVEQAFARAKQVGAITIFDPAPVRPLSDELLRHVDYLTPNQTEAAALLGDPALTIDDYAAAERVAERLLARGPAAVVLKLGPLGCLLATREQRMAVSGFTVAAVDTTAAGDTFNGAFAVALAEGHPAPQAARFANAAAALSVTRPGAQSAIPCREEVEAFLATHSAS